MTEMKSQSQLLFNPYWLLFIRGREAFNLKTHSSPTFTPFKEPACPPQRATKVTCCFHSLPQQHESQEGLPEFLICPHQFLLIKESNDPDHINIELKCYEEVNIRDFSQQHEIAG